ncbi:phage tail tape measure protein [Exiguobacterium sp. SL14]|nr:phage tail tape measure protein [Exiguobacterium sp. SL14]MCY1690741.1 phage tail tape measure protein [Exiguobacterium sp. SL14]
MYSNNFGESWDDVARSLSTVKQITGETGKELQNMTQNAIGLRDTFGFEVNESIRSVDTMMQKQFGISSTEAFNLIAQGQQNGLDKSGEMLDTINEYSVQFKALGMDADTMFETMVSGMDNGAWNLDKVGDAVKEFNIRSKDGSKTSIAAYKELGLNADQMMQTFAAGGPKASEAFQSIVTQIAAIEDPVKRNALGVALFGTQFEDLEVKAFAALGKTGDKVDQTKNSMDQINKVKYDTPAQAFKGLGREIETGIVKPLSESLMPAINGFVSWVKGNMPAVVGIFAFITVAVIALAVAITVSLVAAGIAASTAFLPIILIGVGIAAFVALVITIFMVFRGKWGTIWQSIKDTAVNIWNATKSWLISAFQSTVAFLSTVWSGLKTAAVAAWNMLKSGVLAIVSGLVTAVKIYFLVWKTVLLLIWTGIKVAAVAAWNFLKSAVLAIVQGLVTATTATINFWKSALLTSWSNIKTAAVTAWNFLKTAILAVITGLIAVATGIFNGFMAGLSAIWSFISSAAIAAWNLIRSSVMSAISGLISAKTRNPKRIHGRGAGDLVKYPKRGNLSVEFNQFRDFLSD